MKAGVLASNFLGRVVMVDYAEDYRIITQQRPHRINKTGITSSAKDIHTNEKPKTPSAAGINTCC